MKRSWGKHSYHTNRHVARWTPEPKWRCTVRGMTIVWLIALIWTWLMGFGVVKLIGIMQSYLIGNA